MDEKQTPTVAQVFDMLASTYDQTGVEFFGPVGAKLVELLDAQPGERCLDVGCGRGAVTLPLAAAVGAGGSVHGVDVSPGMLEEARGLAARAGLTQATFDVADAGDLSHLPADHDVVASSLVLFFLADPASALRTWVERLAPGGRIGLVTFGVEDEASNALVDLLDPYVPPTYRDPKFVAAESPFTSESGMERLLGDAGAREVSTTLVPTTLEFPDVLHWQRFSLSTGQRAMWMRMPEEDKPRILAQADEILESTRTSADQPCRLIWNMRYTLGRR
ncbi:class I SAM-dependent methyltransferase [Nocardioides marmorisolisilvae]|uniref:Methyltransferase domain-containing protein n=1 Tax=Nocardioides marmorisolisilvae TaxID=1542737 RepID=A0A3N0DUG3_9ACTN|nr:methyltransferase domain-containing protein [Nocardioides marmorisolisilvae]RNL79265.1 methyltransferase domain-containing protein [Nocardioides marmorisolisilvae]